eukprot:jgi/Ulvmu1/7254/UM035_0041.1
MPCLQVQHAAPDIVTSELRQMMHGALVELRKAGCALVGGHSSKGSETTLGFSVTGHAKPIDLMLKSSLRPGERLVLTKSLGTGVLMRGAMLGKAHGEHQRLAWESMLQSNQAACHILQRHGVRACTDVTGFGVLGHVVEMADASQVNIELEMSCVPLLPGAKELLRMGVQSTAASSNAHYLQYVNRDKATGLGDERLILFDPQTSGKSAAQACRYDCTVDSLDIWLCGAGGLLFSVMDDKCPEVLHDLLAAEYHACVIGKTLAGTYSRTPVHLAD